MTNGAAPISSRIRGRRSRKRGAPARSRSSMPVILRASAGSGRPGSTREERSTSTRSPAAATSPTSQTVSPRSAASPVVSKSRATRGSPYKPVAPGVSPQRSRVGPGCGSTAIHDRGSGSTLPVNMSICEPRISDPVISSPGTRGGVRSTIWRQIGPGDQPLLKLCQRFPQAGEWNERQCPSEIDPTLRIVLVR